MSNLSEVKKQAQNTQLVTVEDFLKKNDQLIKMALRNTITPERFLALATIVIQEPALQGCSQDSLISAMLQTIQVGLTPGKIGHVYYVPFWNSRKQCNEAQLQIGYKGFVELVNRSKEASILTSEVVFEKDQFEYEQGLNPRLRHVPATEDRGAMIGVYCIAKNMLANEKVFVYVPKEEILKIKNESLSKVKPEKQQYTPWVKWEKEMWQKTAVRRIVKLLPLSVEVQQKINADETIKVNISDKMTEMPDKTDWNATEAEIVPEKAQQEAQEDVSSHAQAENVVTLGSIEIGAVMPEFKGLVKSYKTRLVGKDEKKKEITDYSVEDETGVTYSISRWGSVHKGVENAICVFKNIKVGEFKSNRTYMAEEVKTQEEINWEE